MVKNVSSTKIYENLIRWSFWNMLLGRIGWEVVIECPLKFPYLTPADYFYGIFVIKHFFLILNYYMEVGRAASF